MGWADTIKFWERHARAKGDDQVNPEAERQRRVDAAVAAYFAQRAEQEELERQAMATDDHRRWSRHRASRRRRQRAARQTRAKQR